MDGLIRDKKIGQCLEQNWLEVEYAPVHRNHMVGISLHVWVRKELLQELRDVRSQTIGVGLMGVAGNKGACVVRFGQSFFGYYYFSLHCFALNFLSLPSIFSSSSSSSVWSFVVAVCR